MELAFLCRPHPLETLCGDAVAVVEAEDSLTVAVIDGLGHGPEAHRAAELARRTIEALHGLAPSSLLMRCHDALRPTRGAAIGVLRLEPQGRGSFAGIGNVALAARSREPIHPISYPGIVGHRLRKVVDHQFLWSAGDLLCLHSDGLQTRLDLDSLGDGPLRERAALLVEWFGRDTDDASVALISV